MPKYCCTLLYKRKPNPLERSTVRGFSDSDSIAGHSSTAPIKTPSTASSARQPKWESDRLYSPDKSFTKKYSSRNTTCPAKKK